MPDPASPPAPPAPPAPAPTKFAGKYDTPEALESGARELRKKMGLAEHPADKPLVGKDGLYTSHAALETAYKDMETMFGKVTSKPNEKPAEPKPGEPALKLEGGETPGEPEIPDDAGIDHLLKDMKLDGQKLAERFIKDGKLDDADYKTFREKKGLTRAMVDTVMRGQAAIAELNKRDQAAMRKDAIEIAGGEEQLNLLLKSAKDYVPADEIEDLNDRLSSPKSYKGALRDLMQHYAKHNGSDGASPIIVGGGKPAPSGPAKDLTEFQQLQAAAARGDESALARINATPVEKIQSWVR